MLSSSKSNQKVLLKSIALLFFISCITFHTIVFADIQEKAAEQYRALGYEEQQKGNLNEALSYYTKAVALGMVGNAVLLNDMGTLYEEIDLNAKAEHYYLKAIQSDEHYLPSYINLAYLYQRLGRKDSATLYFKKRYELGDPLDPWAQKAKAELLKMSPEYYPWALSLEADSLNKELVTKSRNEFNMRVQQSQEYHERGKQLFNDGQYKEALREYNSALSLTPNNPKIKDARNKVILELAKESVREQSEQAIIRLETGDTVSARHEIQKILTTIPSEPMLISR
jgi:tetratricopeptide (TPR) repeat protein